ncbi:MAG: DUF4238 domain-containing protein [Candidatus Acidiferrales bacterium]
MNEPRKHHYVPVVYQKRFVNEQGLLWVYDRLKKSFAERHPSAICCEKDLYAVKPEGAPKDQRLESIALAQADGDCATDIRSLIYPLAGLPGHYVRSLVSYFVGLQYSRLPSMREYVTTMWERGVKETMRLTAVNEGRMQSVMDRYERETGDKVAASARTMVEVIQRDGLKIVVNELPFLRYVFRAAKIVADTVIRSSWQVLRAPGGAGFVLCDAPVVVVPPRGVRQVGFYVPGTVTYVPLSRETCLRLSNPKRGRLQYREVDSRTVRIINQDIAANSDRFIMGPVKQEVETIVALSGCEAPNATPRAAFRRRAENDDGSFDEAVMNPRNYFYLPDGRSP